MNVIINIIFIIIGFVLLMKGADFLVDGASAIASKFGIPQIIIGLTVVAIGTSMPELMVSASAALSGFSDLSIGNVVGSNIANILLILGTCAIINNLEFKHSTAKVESPFMIFVTILLFVMANMSNEHIITRINGLILLTLCILYLAYNVYMAKKAKEIKQDKEDSMSITLAIIYVICGIAALKFGGDFVVDNATSLAKTIGISEKLIGVTIVSVATSLPELVTSITATRKGTVDIAIGNIIGSNIFNIVLILGVSSIISPIHYAVSYNFDLMYLIVVSILFGIIPFIKKRYQMVRYQGIIFVLLYVAFIVRAIIKG